MKLLIDDTTARTHCLNANEACVYAAILKCTKAGRGWYASYSELANALPFVVSAETVRRNVVKLFNLGLLERREKALFAIPQNVEDVPQNVEDVPQNVAKIPQNVANSDSPYNPLNINNEKMNENNATCAHTCDTHTPEIPSFNDLCNAYRQQGGKINNYEAGEAYDEWNKCSNPKKVKLLAALKTGNFFKPRIDWLITDFPEPVPTNFQGTAIGGEMLAKGTAKVAKYNGRFGVYSTAEIALFNLPIAKQITK